MAILNDRIKRRREDLEMSQAELAEILGYSDRSTIAKIEKGINDITQSKIAAFADALHTTPAYLMGWTSDPYDYELDPDNRFCEIPIAQFEALKETYSDDLAAVWRAWVQIQEDTLREASVGYTTIKKMPTPEGEQENPDIRMIARAGKKMTPEQAENLRKLAQYMFPEAFDDNE